MSANEEVTGVTAKRKTRWTGFSEGLRHLWRKLHSVTTLPASGRHTIEAIRGDDNVNTSRKRPKSMTFCRGAKEANIHPPKVVDERPERP